MYYYAEGEQQRGPVSLADLPRLGVKPQTLIWKEGMSEWVEARTVPEVAVLLLAPPVSPAPPAGPGLSPPSLGPLPYATPPLTVQNTGFAVAGMVLGIVSLVMLAMLCTWPVAIITGILGVIFSSVAREKIKRGQASGRGMALAGLICSSITLGLFAVGVCAGIIGQIARR